MEELKKTVIITGAAFGVGNATAKILAANGFHVIATSRNMDELNKIKSDNIDVYQLDVTDELAAKEFADTLSDKNVVALINNAGGGFNLPGNILNDDMEDWRKSYEVNVIGVVSLTKLIAPHMIKNGGGNVVIISSMAGHFTYKGGSNYTVAKHATVALADLLRFEFFDKNIRVTEIAPGNINSRGDRDPNTCLNPEDVADAIRWAITVPSHVNVEKLTIMHVNNLSR